ncbi:hypothetical protein SAMN05443550_103337 [Pedobacter hartonius]|uniref:Uncharacterized protein n=1 Tax=Pedobacter hartonius TaxID=425514 RepID=A0A1H4BGD5_9SPHI|nr:hypothetical protein SAMN05443550_103337 [Pedobacter hartonius]
MSLIIHSAKQFFTDKVIMKTFKTILYYGNLKCTT